MPQAEARAAAEQSVSSAKLRHAGNKAFQRGRVEEAVRLYSEVRLSNTPTRKTNYALLGSLLPLATSQAPDHFWGSHSMVCRVLG